VSDNNKALGAISALCTFGLLVFIAVKTQAIGTAGSEFLTLLSGGVNQIVNNDKTFLMMFPIIVAVVVLELPATILAAIFQAKLLGKSGKHGLTELFREMGEGNHFFTFFVLVLVEELFARWLFLGVLTKIPFLSGAVAFYALFLIGNGIWALIHLSNFKEEKDRRMLRVLPQFVAGAFFTFVFVKYGLLAVVLTHFASNAVLFAFHKIQRVNVIDALIVGYAALCAGVSYWLIDKPVTDILPWFADNPTFVLTGWEFWDYLKVSVFLSSCFVIVFGFLLYDRGAVQQQKDGKEYGLPVYLIGLAIVIGLLYGLYALLGLFIASVPYRILVLAILFTFLQKGASGSAVARSFWTGLPNVYITMCILQALGFWLAVGYVLAEAVIEAPRMVLLKRDN
jgi:hypothetical protein